jgi:hypothetical protein
MALVGAYGNGRNRYCVLIMPATFAATTSARTFAVARQDYPCPSLMAEQHVTNGWISASEIIQQPWTPRRRESMQITPAGARVYRGWQFAASLKANTPSFTIPSRFVAVKVGSYR